MFPYHWRMRGALRGRKLRGLSLIRQIADWRSRAETKVNSTFVPMPGFRLPNEESKGFARLVHLPIRIIAVLLERCEVSLGQRDQLEPAVIGPLITESSKALDPYPHPKPLLSNEAHRSVEEPFQPRFMFGERTIRSSVGEMMDTVHLNS